MKRNIVAVGLLLALMFMAPGWLSADEWQQTTLPGTPSARFGHSMVKIDGKFYVFGGQTGTRSVLLNDLNMFDPGKNEWDKQIPANDPPPTRQGHSAVAYNGQMYVFSGQGDQGDLDDVWVYDPANKTWQQKANGGAPARVNHTTIVVDGKILVFGGRTSSGQVYEDLWSYNPQTTEWEAKEPVFQNYGRFGHSALPVDDMMYVFAGEGQGVYNNMLVYNLSEDSWSIFNPQGDIPPARSLHVSASEGYTMWITGGIGSQLQDTWVFDASTNAWMKKADSTPIAQGAAAIFDAQSTQNEEKPKIFMFGGQRDGQPVAENWQYYEGSATLATGIPSSYKVTVTKVEMWNGTSWVTIFSGTAQLDMAAGGTFPGISDLSLPAGTYSQVRVTFNNSFPVAGALSYGGAAYYTTATTFGGQTNLASTPTTVAGSMAAFTFYNPAWGGTQRGCCRDVFHYAYYSWTGNGLSAHPEIYHKRYAFV